MGGSDSRVTATVRDARCKDCVRERQYGWDDPDAPQAEAEEHFEYNEAWAQSALDRGGNRTDRCPRHRRLHKQEISGLAVAYIDLQTIGDVQDRQNPLGPLGGLGPLPELHRPRQATASTPFSKFGMNDDQVREIYSRMSNPSKRVLILKAGTGTGKSTFFPFRLLCPPEGVDFSFTARGPIVVTEPRVQATVGVSRYVGERLVMGCPLMECSVHGSFNPKSHLDDPAAPAGPTCTDPEHCGRSHVGDHPGPKGDDCCVVDCARHIGPGYPVGYQVKGDARHDPGTQLVYVTDGTMINWLREGRLNKIGTVVVDEAHERSTNIDFIMGYLRREIDRYPHLRVIITSATFDVPFYEDYFGGAERVETMDVPAQKSFGYGAPLFPIVDGNIACGCEADEHGIFPHEPTSDYDTWLRLHWPPEQQYGPQADDGSPPEDLWATTRQLHDLRSTTPLPDDEWELELSAKAKKQLTQDIANHVVSLVTALDERQIYGDVLAFLPNNKLISEAVSNIEKGVDLSRADVFALIQSAPTEQKEAALESRPRGSKRKIVVSTNLAETSLTVSGVRFVVDSGLTTQGAWDPTLASKSVPTTLHSQAGVRQRWGRVGRDAPGWVFPLYTRSQFDELPRNTPPGSTRDNLEQLIMKAKSAGIDDVAGFPWPAAHEFGDLDKSARDAMEVFDKELQRADSALLTSGVVDSEGHLTAFGKELERFGQHSAGFAVATIIADQLACVPEVVTALILLEAQKAQGFESVDLRSLPLFDRSWPQEWRDLAADRWQQLHAGCLDDLDVAIRVVGLWERADPERRPWEPSPAREEWARRWWVKHDLLLQLAELRRSDLEGLSAAMKEDVKRFLEPRLTPRARAAITRAFVGMRYRDEGDQHYISAENIADPAVGISHFCHLDEAPDDVIALTRETNQLSGNPEIRNLVAVTSWAAGSNLDAMDLVLLCAEHCHPRDLAPGEFDSAFDAIQGFPIGAHVELTIDGSPPSLVKTATKAPFSAPATVDPEAEVDDTPQAEPSRSAAGAGWPAGFTEPIEDEEQNERLRLEEPDNDEREPNSGRPVGLETNDDDELPGARVIDVLWDGLNETPTGETTLHVAGAPAEEAGWYRCCGYETGPDGFVVNLEPLPAGEIEVSDPAINASYSLFDDDMLVLGVVGGLSDRGLQVRFRDKVTGFSVRSRLPREDYEPGDEVVARVHEIDADTKRLILDMNPKTANSIKAIAPGHWQAALRFRVNDFNASLGAKVWANGLELSVGAASADDAAALADRLRKLLGSPVAAVDVPSDRHGLVQGARGAHLIEARTETGALICDFVEGSHTLLVSAETNEQLANCVDRVCGYARACTGRLIVPSGRTGALIGSGGSVINELKATSGCQRANAGPDGHFALFGPTRETLERFAALASAKVPGCQLVDVVVSEPTVRDVLGGPDPVEWRNHAFARGDESIDIKIDTPVIVDMRPTDPAPVASKPRRASKTSSSRDGDGTALSAAEQKALLSDDERDEITEATARDPRHLPAAVLSVLKVLLGRVATDQIPVDYVMRALHDTRVREVAKMSFDTTTNLLRVAVTGSELCVLRSAADPTKAWIAARTDPIVESPDMVLLEDLPAPSPADFARSSLKHQNLRLPNEPEEIGEVIDALCAAPLTPGESINEAATRLAESGSVAQDVDASSIRFVLGALLESGALTGTKRVDAWLDAPLSQVARSREEMLTRLQDLLEDRLVWDSPAARGAISEILPAAVSEIAASNEPATFGRSLRGRFGR